MSPLRGTYRRFKKRWKIFWSINWMKTWYFNYKMFPYSIASKLPVVFYGRVKFTCLDGKITIDAPIKKGMIGFGQAYEKSTRESGIAEINLQGELVFKGYAQFGKDYLVYIHNGGYCEFGHMASLASSGRLICYKSIVLGTYARIGSQGQLIDTNFHQMIDTKTGERLPKTGSIQLGDYNFVSNRVTIMQKTKTPNNCTIASNTLCNKDYTDLGENILIGGIPAKLLREHISRDWEGEKDQIESSLKVFES
ncbi:transferase [Aureisphaera galaxeae]|uniref:acyltransferase n=1 Tax=Aureisphaera galaxeae TaxID=1538023 RepID=UPI002350A762|nr:transferase [Aureisphaera galaxeae]MDC8004460.1 transferase [Aureisphaera galaxeae]